MSKKPSKELARRTAVKPAKRPTTRALLMAVRELIVQARAGVARAEYGVRIVAALGRQLGCAEPHPRPQ